MQSPARPVHLHLPPNPQGCADHIAVGAHLLWDCVFQQHAVQLVQAAGIQGIQAAPQTQRLQLCEGGQGG